MNTSEATHPVRLTRHSHGAGCGCKISPAELEKILKSSLGTLPDPRLLVGYGSRDDAAVYDLGNGRALISTTDFFPPIVDDAFTFGRIAAANALSDVYAMGGRPMLAVAILGWPIEKLGAELARQVVEGGRKTCHDAGIALAGGHSIDAPEPFFGLAVTGEAPIAHVKRNDTATAGCTLILTKPLGTGILSTAQKRGKLDPAAEAVLIDQLCTINTAGAELGAIAGVKAMTDVTGFGLLGHLLEMCEGSGLSARLRFDSVPLIPSARRYLDEGCYPDGTMRNWKAYGAGISGAQDMTRMLTLSDPQTNGGLLIAVEQGAVPQVEGVLVAHGAAAHRIGALAAGDPRIVVS